MQHGVWEKQCISTITTIAPLTSSKGRGRGPSAVRLSWHDDVIKWWHFPCHCPSVWELHRSGIFSSKDPVKQSFDVFFDLRLNKRLSKKSRRRWLETPSHLLWRHCNELMQWRYPVCRSFHCRTWLAHKTFFVQHEFNREENNHYYLRANKNNFPANNDYYLRAMRQEQLPIEPNYYELFSNSREKFTADAYWLHVWG